MKAVRFGIIGAGLMGREFASAAARWCHLQDIGVQPVLVSVCDKNAALLDWYRGCFNSVSQCVDNYHAVLENREIDAVYVALPHHLHQEVYCAAIRAGKHLMGEKPFGIDKPACDAIVACARQHPDVLVRCSSESVFFPAVQRIASMIEAKAIGTIIELETGFLHSSDLDPGKPINWKRMIEFNGEYGVMGDLGMHACHLPFRAGWHPMNVRGILSDIVKERPDGKGGIVPCRTWDNAILFSEMNDPATGHVFPWIMKTQRIAPGQKNNWYVSILGTKGSARWSSVNADILDVMNYDGGEQVWGQIQTGHETAFKTITGGIFQFGFSDSILQMWAAFLYELAHKRPLTPFAGCVTPDEAAASHRLFSAALVSQKEHRVVDL